MRLIVCLTLLLINFTSYAQVIRRLDNSTIRVDSFINRVQYLMKAANVAGLGIAVFNQNKPLLVQSFGLADVPHRKPLSDSSVLYAASLAKVVFAYQVMQLVEEGVLELDKPLVKYLERPLVAYKIKGWRRGYADLQGDERYTKITARMCLTHTTGFPNWRWFEADKKLKIKFDPGTRYSYSGEGLYLLQFVIEQLTGKDYETLSQERVFQPLGMQHSSQLWRARFDSLAAYGHNAQGIPYELMRWQEASAGGSMSTSLHDYVKFYSAFIQHQGLGEASFKEMIRPQVRIHSKRQFGPEAWVDVADNDGIALSYGLGVGLLTSPHGRAFFKEGHDEGWGHYCICFPDKGIAILMMTNNDNGESLFKELLAEAIGDTFTPWQWENYIPYSVRK